MLGFHGRHRCLLSAVCCLLSAVLQSATFKVNIRFSNVASELLVWVSQAVCRVVGCYCMFNDVCIGGGVVMVRTKQRNNGGLCDLALVQAVSSSIAHCWSSTITQPCQLHRLTKVFCWLRASAMAQCRAWPTCSIDTPQVTTESSAEQITDRGLPKHMSCRVCVAATPLAPDYQRDLEPIQCVDVERLPRLPVANEKGRVGRQVMLLVPCGRCWTFS